MSEVIYTEDLNGFGGIRLEFKWAQLTTEELRYKVFPDNPSCRGLALFPEEFKSTAAFSGQDSTCSWLMLTDQSYYIVCIIQLYMLKDLMA